MKPVKLTVLAFFLAIGFSANAQDTKTLYEKFDLLAADWLKVSGEMKTYSGLEYYCRIPAYRSNTLELLHQIHSYDSLILEVTNDPNRIASPNEKELKNTLKDITKMEEEYSLVEFKNQLKSSCDFRKDIEKNKESSKNDFADESYDGQILILETEIRKYLRHIDNLVLKIDDHLLMLHIDEK
jgi:hypothetical protein